MPTYTYRCLSCQHSFEETLGLYEKAIVLCPTCQERAERILSESPAVLRQGKSQRPVAQDWQDLSDISSIEEETLPGGAKSPGACGCILHACVHHKKRTSSGQKPDASP
ncbi:MAG: zinc ribbon domain-containing protein [Vampirovibrionales bacterium]|nr:zinc ribbon domain-containing protein [Vampirovibrionales bacterium]